MDETGGGTGAAWLAGLPQGKPPDIRGPDGGPRAARLQVAASIWAASLGRREISGRTGSMGADSRGPDAPVAAMETRNALPEVLWEELSKKGGALLYFDYNYRKFIYFFINIVFRVNYQHQI